MSRTRKPCPGCGEVHPHRPADKVCWQCERLMEAGRLLKKQQRKRYPRQYRLPRRAYGLPYVRNVGQDSRQTFQQAVYDLAIALSETSVEYRHDHADDLLPDGNDRPCSDSSLVYVESATRDTLYDLYAAVQAMTEEAYKKGKRDGGRFIDRLCRGEVSVDEFNQVTMAQEEADG